MICFGDNGEYEESADYDDDYTDKNYTSDYEEALLRTHRSRKKEMQSKFCVPEVRK